MQIGGLTFCYGGEGLVAPGRVGPILAFPSRRKTAPTRRGATKSRSLRLFVNPLHLIRDIDGTLPIRVLSVKLCRHLLSRIVHRHRLPLEFRRARLQVQKVRSFFSDLGGVCDWSAVIGG